jgi:hypothetical protein
MTKPDIKPSKLTFDAIHDKAFKLGIKYRYVPSAPAGQEYQVTWNGHTWTRGSGSAIGRLIQELVRRAEKELAAPSTKPSK